MRRRRIITITTMTTITTTTDRAALLHLLAWLSPAFPIGALRLLARPGMGGRSRRRHRRRHPARLGRRRPGARRRPHRRRSCCATPIAPPPIRPRCADSPNWPRRRRPARERRRRSAEPGRRLRRCRGWLHGWPRPLPDDLPYAVAVGAAAPARHAHPRGRDAARLSAGLRRQSDLRRRPPRAARARPPACGARRAGTVIPAVADDTPDATLDDLGGCAFRSDIAAMRHETQYTRLFRS